MNSGFLKLNLKDLGKGTLVAFLTVVVGGIYTTLQSGAFPDIATLQGLAITGLTAAAAYLLKNLFTNSSGEVAKSE